MKIRAGRESYPQHSNGFRKYMCLIIKVAINYTKNNCHTFLIVLGKAWMFGDVLKLLMQLNASTQLKRGGGGGAISDLIVFAYNLDPYMIDELLYNSLTEWKELLGWFVNSPVNQASKTYIV